MVGSFVVFSCTDVVNYSMLDSSQTAEFVWLWTLHGRSVYAYLLTLTSNDADADEMYQDVGMTLWEKFDQFTPGTSFRARARQIALYKVRNFRRLRRHGTILCSPEFFDSIERVMAKKADVVEAQHTILADCLGKLPPKHKDLIDQRYQPGATPSSVAQQTGRSVKAIYEALRRIQRVLFDCVHKTSLGKGIA